MTYDAIDELEEKLHTAEWNLKEAKEEIEAQAKRIAELEAALKPFADARHMEGLANWIEDGSVIGCGIQVRDLHQARKVLGEKND
jgi:hypothetical protein